MATPVLIKRQLKLHEDQALPSTIPLLIRDNYQYDEENHKLVERPAKSSKFKLVPAAVKLLASIKKPVAVLAICGPTRTGKSYFLSQMLEEPDAFQLGHTMQGCTHGIWMGTSVLECDEFVLLLLDTEGINAVDASGATDATILIMAILLSSYLIYNSKNVPSRTDLEGMSFVTHISSSILVHDGCENDDLVDFRQHFPDFLWLLRDVTLIPADRTGKYLTPTEFLKTQVLVRSKRAIPTCADNVAVMIMNYFPTVECLILPPPSADMEVTTKITENEDKLSPDFISCMQEAVKYVHQKVSRKKGFNTSATVNGDTLAQLASKYLDAINTGATPTLENTWVTVVEQRLSETTDRLVAEYKQEMEAALQDKLPMEEYTLLENHQNLLGEKRAALLNEIQLLMPVNMSEDSQSVATRKEKFIAHFERQIAQYSEAGVDGTNIQGVTGGILWNFLRENFAKSKHVCLALFNELFDPIERKITAALGNEAAACAYTFPDLCMDIEQMQKSYDTRAIGPMKHELYTQKEREVLQHRKDMLKHVVGFSERLLTAQNKAKEADNEAKKLGESVQLLENKVKEKAIEQLQDKLEHERTLREIEEKERRTLNQEMEKQKEFMQLRMEESVSASKAKYEEIQTLSREQIKQVKEAQRKDQKRHAAEIGQLKKASEVTQQKHAEKEAELRQQIQLIQEETREVIRNFETALDKLGRETEEVKQKASSAKERAEIADEKADKEERYRRALHCALVNRQKWYLLSDPHSGLAKLLQEEFDRDYGPGWQCIVARTGFNKMNDVPDSYPVPIPSASVDVLMFKASTTPSKQISEEMKKSVTDIAKRRLAAPKRSKFNADDSNFITKEFTKKYGPGWQCVTSENDFHYAMNRDCYYFWIGWLWTGYICALLYCR